MTWALGEQSPQPTPTFLQEQGAHSPGHLDQGIPGTKWPQRCPSSRRWAPSARGVSGECPGHEEGPDIPHPIPTTSLPPPWWLYSPPIGTSHITVFSVCPVPRSLSFLPPLLSGSCSATPPPALRMSEIPQGIVGLLPNSSSLVPIPRVALSH